MVYDTGAQGQMAGDGGGEAKQMSLKIPTTSSEPKWGTVYRGRDTLHWKTEKPQWSLARTCRSSERHVYRQRKWRKINVATWYLLISQMSIQLWYRDGQSSFTSMRILNIALCLKKKSVFWKTFLKWRPNFVTEDLHCWMFSVEDLCKSSSWNGGKESFKRMDTFYEWPLYMGSAQIPPVRGPQFGINPKLGLMYVWSFRCSLGSSVSSQVPKACWLVSWLH